MEYTVRTSQIADIPAIVAFTKESWARTYDPVIGEAARREVSDAKHVPELFESEIGTDTGVSYLAIANHDGEQVIGHAGGPMKSAGCIYIDRLHVDPQAWGTGVAAALLDAVAANDHVTMLELTVLDGNDRAMAFYMKYGFKVIERRGPECGMGGRGDIVLQKQVSR